MTPFETGKGPDHSVGTASGPRNRKVGPQNAATKEISAMQKIPRDWIERAARVYNSNADASRALGIAGGTFGRLCRQYKIETPFARQRRRRRDPASPRAGQTDAGRRSDATSDRRPSLLPSSLNRMARA